MRRDVDAVDPDVADLAVDVDILQPRAAQRRAGEVHVAEPRAAEIDLLEPRAGQILLHELGHAHSLSPGSDVAERPYRPPAKMPGPGPWPAITVGSFSARRDSLYLHAVPAALANATTQLAMT